MARRDEKFIRIRRATNDSTLKRDMEPMFSALCQNTAWSSIEMNIMTADISGISSYHPLECTVADTRAMTVGMTAQYDRMEQTSLNL
jgi:hypothetical protein